MGANDKIACVGYAGLTAHLFLVLSDVERHPAEHCQVGCLVGIFIWRTKSRMPQVRAARQSGSY